MERFRGMTAEEARARAARYRQLAREVTDDQMREGLLELAAEYEALAERLLTGAVGRNGSGPQNSGPS